MKLSIKHVLYTLLFGFGAAAALLASGAGEKDLGKEKAGTTRKPLVVNLEGGDWGYPSPYTHYSRGPGIFKMTLIFDSLLERGERGIIPWLAESWTVSPDGATYVFTLRPSVKWHDGKPLTAADVKFSFEYFAKHPPVSDSLSQGGRSIIEKIETEGPRTVRISVREPNAAALGLLGTARILPAHVWEKVADPRKFTAPEAVTGSGPFKLVRYDKEQGAYRYEAFQDFWGPAPRVEVLQFVPVSDPVLAFEKGEIDLATLPPDVLPRFRDKPGFAFKRNPAFWGYRLLFNMKKRPDLADSAVRKAIAFAVDAEELAAKVERGAAVPASPGYLPAGHVLYNPAVEPYPFDPAKARDLLGGKTLSFTLLTANSPAEVRIGELLKLSLAKAGITVAVKSVDMKSRDGAVKKGDYEFALLGHGGWGNDPDMLRDMYGSKKSSSQSPSAVAIPGFFDEEIADLCERQYREIDAAKRKITVFRLQALIAEAVPQLPLYNTTGTVVFRPEKYDGWKYMFDHHEVTHNKLSYVKDTPNP